MTKTWRSTSQFETCSTPFCGSVGHYFCVRCRHYFMECRCGVNGRGCDCADDKYWCVAGEIAEAKRQLAAESK